MVDLTDSASRKKKVYEQQENEENPLRCPVKLYEFYLSKWWVLRKQLIIFLRRRYEKIVWRCQKKCKIIAIGANK